MADRTVGEVRSLVQRPKAADLASFAHAEGGEHLEFLAEFLCKLIQAVAVNIGIAHGGNLQALGTYALYVVVLQTQLPTGALWKLFKK